MDPQERSGRTSLLVGLGVAIVAIFILYLIVTLAGMLD